MTWAVVRHTTWAYDDHGFPVSCHDRLADATTAAAAIDGPVAIIRTRRPVTGDRES